MLRVLPTEGLSILTKLKISIARTPPNDTDLCFYEPPLPINIDAPQLTAPSATLLELEINFNFYYNDILKIDQRYALKWILRDRFSFQLRPIDRTFQEIAYFGLLSFLQKKLYLHSNLDQALIFPFFN